MFYYYNYHPVLATFRPGPTDICFFPPWKTICIFARHARFNEMEILAMIASSTSKKHCLILLRLQIFLPNENENSIWTEDDDSKEKSAMILIHEIQMCTTVIMIL